jgi:hypothetical protein
MSLWGTFHFQTLIEPENNMLTGNGRSIRERGERQRGEEEVRKRRGKWMRERGGTGRRKERKQSKGKGGYENRRQDSRGMEEREEL